MIEGVNTQAQRSDARENGFDLLQVQTFVHSVREAA